VIKADGIAWCVGSNDFSYLTHDGTSAMVVSPAVQFDVNPVGSIAAGPDFACIASCSGETKCVGENNFGELGDGQDTSSTALVVASGPDSVVCAIIK
jgi:alpha-tubulin suppressor-like RCC1 family protein